MTPVEPIAIFPTPLIFQAFAARIATARSFVGPSPFTACLEFR